jgi:hypothetical protein
MGLAALVLAPLGYLISPSLLNLVNATPAVRAETLSYLRIMILFSFGSDDPRMLGQPPTESTPPWKPPGMSSHCVA